ncbi:MAG: hypothetical protein ACLFTI_06500 [Anaerolineales bacterium]
MFLKRNRNVRIWLGLLLGALLLAPACIREARAQAPDSFPEMIVTSAWEDHLRMPGWTEVRVALRNEVGDWEGELLIIDVQNEVTYRRAVQLPARSYKQYRIPLYMENALDYEVVLQGEQQAARSKLALNRINAKDRVCVVADARDVTAYELEACETRIWLQDLAQLPETSQAWDTIDLLMLNGMATSALTDQQRAALVSWVGMGGHIIVGGGASLPQALDGFPAKLRVAAPMETQLMDATILGDRNGNGVAEGRIAVTSLTLRDTASSLLSAEGDAVIAARERLGAGIVDIVGWDLTTAAGQAWTAMLWEGDQTPAVRLPFASSGISSVLQPQARQLLQMPISAIPRLWQWLLLFPLYLLLMGPGTLWIVRRLRRPILAWVLLPLWIVTSLLLLSLVLSGVFSRTFPLFHERATIYVSAADMPARVFQGAAIYAPRVRGLSWRGAGKPRPLFGGYRFDSWYNSGESFPVEVNATGQAESEIIIPQSLGVVTWGLEGEISPPQIQADLRLEAREGAPWVIGEIHSDVALENVKLLFYSNEVMHHLPLTTTVEPETPTRVSWVVTDTTSQRLTEDMAFCESPHYGGYYHPVPLMPSQLVVDEIQNTLSCYLAAKTEGVPFPAQGIRGTQVSESCWVIRAPCPQQSAGSLRIPLVPDHNSVEGGWLQEENVLAMGESTAEVRYVVPAYLQISRADALTVTLSQPPWLSPPSGTSPPPIEVEEIALWDWEQETWSPYSLPPGRSLHLEGETAAAHFDPQEGVRLQLAAQSSDKGVMVQIEITVMGSW